MAKIKMMPTLAKEVLPMSDGRGAAGQVVLADSAAISSRSASSVRPAAAVPDPEVPEKAVRRRFTAEYKLRILREAEGCETPGAVGALLRRHVLTSAYAAHPERFVRKPPAPLAVPTAVWINRPDPPARPYPEGETGGCPDMPGPPIDDPGGAEPLASWGAWPPNPSVTPIHALQVVRRRSSAAAEHDETSTRAGHSDQPAPAAPASAKALP